MCSCLSLVLLVLLINTMATTLPSRCARLGCNHPAIKPFIMSDGPTRQKIYFPSTESNSLCDTHMQQYVALFDVSKLSMQIDADLNSEMIDFVSSKKSQMKVPEKTFSILPLAGTDSFRITSATFSGRFVKRCRLAEILTGTTLGKRQRDPIDVFVGSCEHIAKLRAQYFESQLSLEDTVVPGDDESPAPFLVSIEGNIGAGKSTLLAELRRLHPDWHFIDEPLDTWTSLRNEKNQSLLEIFYEDKQRWSYSFQNCALLSRFQLIENAIRENSHQPPGLKKRKVFVTERCLDTDDQVFAKMLKDDGLLDKLEHELYSKWLKLLKNECQATPLSAIIYVDTDPDLCASRIQSRGRQGESGIPLEYLRSLDKYQRQWVDSTHVPVIRVGAFPDSKLVGDFVEKERSLDVKALAGFDLDENKENIPNCSDSKFLRVASTDGSIRSGPLDSN